MELIAPVFFSYRVNSESVTYIHTYIRMEERTYGTARRYEEECALGPVPLRGSSSPFLGL